VRAQRLIFAHLRDALHARRSAERAPRAAMWLRRRVA
jgi:hypothetical protein